VAAVRLGFGLSVAKWCLNVFELLFDWPNKSRVIGPVDLQTDGDRATFAHWLIGTGMPVLLDFLSIVTDAAMKKDYVAGRALQFVDPIGVFIATALGFGALTSGEPGFRSEAQRG